MHPAIITKLVFLNNTDKEWNIGGGFDFYDYEAKSDGVFDSEHDYLSADQIEQYRDHERVSKSEECPKYLGIISFDNNFLRENNVLVGDMLNMAELKDIARKGINAMIDKSDKLEASNCYWTAGIHTDTENIHMQFSLLEFHRLQDRRKICKDGDKLEQNAIDTLKSKVVNGLEKNKLTDDLTKFERDVLQRQIKYNFQSSKDKIEKLISKLPENRGWQYNRLKSYQNEIDSCIRSVISEDDNLKNLFETYIGKIEAVQENSRLKYGNRSRYANYKESRLHGRDGFYSRVGNSFLNICKQYRDSVDTFSDMNYQDKTEYYQKYYSENFATEDGGYLSKNKIESDFINFADIGGKQSVLDDSYGHGLITSSYEITEDNIADDIPANLSKKEIEIDYSFSEADIPPEDGYYDYPDEPNEEDKRIFENYGYDEGAYLSEKEIYDDAAPPPDEDPVNIFSFSRDESNLSEKESDGRPYISWSLEYKEARKLLYDKNSKLGDIQNAEKLLLQEARSGNALAMNELGKLYSTKKLGEKNEAASNEYYEKAFKAFTEIEPNAKELCPFVKRSTGERINKPTDMRGYVWYRIGKMYSYGLGVEKDEKTAFGWVVKAANQDNEYAQYSLGNMYFYGTGVDKDQKEALKWYKKSSDKGQPYASYAVGTFYANGILVDKDSEKAQKYYKLAFDGFKKIESDGAADDSLLYKLGTMYKNGLGTEKDMKTAIEYFKQAADLENSNAMYEYGKALFEGENIQQDIPKAVEYIEKSIGLGNVNAKRFLAGECLSGKTLTQNVEAGVRMLHEEADKKEKPDCLSAYRLGKLYIKNDYGIPIDLDKAEHYLLIAEKDGTDKGSKFAQYALGCLYYNKENTEKHDLKKAYEWFVKAADQDQPYAQFNLGRMYQNSEYVAQNVDTAQEYYKKALDGFLAMEKESEDNNEPDGGLLYKIGSMYKNGLGTAPDVDKAIEYFRRSAELNDPNAQFEMGKFFISTDDKRQAYRYFKQSADSGHTFGAYYAGRILLDNNAAADIGKGIELLKQAASNDCDAACYCLGCYYSRSDSPAAREQAVRYLSISADSHDNSFAQYRLGKIYLSENKNKEAARYLRMSAENDNPYGQLAYGLLLHKQGQRKAATAWITKAAENGNPFARDVLKSLSQSRRGNITLNMSSAIRSQAAAQSRMMRKTSGMLRNALNSEEAKTARLMMQFEREQELAEARKKNINIG